MKDRASLDRNNLDCIRLIMASIVVLFHLSALANLSELSAFGIYLSPHFAVRSFFVISGLLIYRSYARSSSIPSYMEKRFRRIYPAYFTVVTIGAIALFWLSTSPFSHYFGVGFWKYLGANLLFLNFLAPSLPGVFRSNIVSPVNGALWTLKIEVAFYLLVPVIHSLCRRVGTKTVIAAIFGFSCAWKYGFAWLASLQASRSIDAMDTSRSISDQLAVQFPGQLMYFCAGILLLLYFDWLKLHFPAIACITLVLFLVDHWFTRSALDVFWISGVVFVFGFWRYLGNFSKYGDFSYGIYIVHWPIIQVLIVLGATRLNPVLFCCISLTLIGLTALLLWHLVESRFLQKSSHYKQAFQRAPV